jgi:heptosyltransferase-2
MTQKERPKKILVVAPAWVGDMVMSQVLLKILKAQGDCEIDLLAPPHSGPLAARMPEVNHFIHLPLGHGQLDLSARRALGHSLRERRYDQAIVLPNSWKSALIPWFADIPQRTGWLGEVRFGLLNDLRYLNKEKYPLMIERFAALGLKPHASLPSLPWPSLEADKTNLIRVLAQHGQVVGDKPILGLCPGAEFGPAKRWPEAYFAQVAKEKIAQGWEVWLFGSPKEKSQAEVIQSVTDNRCVDWVGKTALADAIDLMSATQAIVSNDSGLMHIAAALGKPLVVMYGSSSPIFTPPLSHQVKILNLDLACSPCFKRECPLGHMNCLNTMHPEMVLSALDALVKNDANTPR